MKNENNNRHGVHVPILCTISADGGTYAVKYKRGRMPSGTEYNRVTRSGYIRDTFDQVPAGTPVIDYRTADVARLIRLILTADIYEHSGEGMTAAEFVERAREIGATITTL